MISVVIPAHNEGRVITRTLETLTKGATTGEFEIIVVCNGCTDDTASVARAFGERAIGGQHAVEFRVIDTPVGGKARALNLGDQAATGFPRVYIDADVLLTVESLRQLAYRLEKSTGAGTGNGILATAPTASFDLAGCAWAVKAYYDINGLLPSSREGIGGSGVYALSQHGRNRFAAFPEITADDLFVRLQFRPEERQTLADCRSIVFAPKSLADLIAIKTRSHFGAYELRQVMPELWGNRGRSNSREVLQLWKHISLWPKLAVYCYVKVVVRLRARRRLRKGLNKIWERDESSRRIALPGATQRT